jgi:ProP effector
MGFEQLAALKQQLTKQAKQAKEAKEAKEAKDGKRRAAKSIRPAQPAESKTSRRAGAKNDTVDPVLRAIGKLQKRFPAAFPKNPAPKVPLKIGILADLLAAGELGLNEAEIRDAISTWCRGNRYWACLTDGAARVDLTGAAAGVVTARDAAFARNQAKSAHGLRRQGQRNAPPGDATAKQPPPGDAATKQPLSAEGEPA